MDCLVFKIQLSIMRQLYDGYIALRSKMNLFEAGV